MKKRVSSPPKQNDLQIRRSAPLASVISGQPNEIAPSHYAPVRPNMTPRKAPFRLLEKRLRRGRRFN